MTAPTMQAIQIEQFGTPQVLRLVEAAVPVPAGGEVLVKVALAGVNYIDVYMRDGSYLRSHTYRTPLPMTIGMEAVGTIAALGQGVRGFAVGDRVGYCLSRGAYAQYAAVPAVKLVRIPENVPDSVATALMLQGSTAHYLTHSAFSLGPQHTCLVHAGAGGVGQLLIQLAKRRGSRVLATVGNTHKADIARLRGADAAILYRETDFREEVLGLTEGQGVDVVYDSVGRDTLPRSMRSLRRRGTCISFGASSGQPAPVELLELAEAGSVFLTRPHLADYMATPEEIAGRARDLFAAYADGALSVVIDQTVPLAAAREAHERLEARMTHGKQLLHIGTAP